MDERPPRIIAPPRDQMVTVGLRAVLAVHADGKQPLSYEWRKDNFTLRAVSSSSYTTPALRQQDDGASYSVVVANEFGAVVSQPAKITVLAPAQARKPVKVRQRRSSRLPR